MEDENIKIQDGIATSPSDETATDDSITHDTPCEKTSLIDKSKRIFDIVYMALCSAFILVMWCTGFNFLPLIADVLAIVAGIIILIRVAKHQKVGLFLWIAYVVTMAGLFVFFLIWGAESFGKNLWWNLLLCGIPCALAGLLYVTQKLIPKTYVKLVASLFAVLMIATSVIYAFFMNLRCRPTVESLQAGHDDYLNNVKNNYDTQNKPNVLVILMDDMAYSDISAYSYLGSEGATINTPNIDSIAQNGIMMDNFYSASPVCSPSRFSMLTGRYSSRGYLDNVVFPSDIQSDPWSPTHFLNPYQFLNNVDGILGDEITFAEVLQAAGYNTSCIGKWNLGDYGQYLPTNQGFDYFYGSYYVNDMTPYDWVRDTADGSHEVVRTHSENLDQSESTEMFTAEIVNFIESSVENDEKFLCYYTTPWPHHPIYSNNNGTGKGDTTDDTYIACIEEFDKYLGNILDTLKEQGVYDDTLIIFTSDNGPGREGVTGDLRGRKNTTFEGGMKVPMIASYPNGGLGAGSQIANTTLSYYKWQQDGVDVYGSDGVDVTNVASTVKSTTATPYTTKRIDASSMNFDLFTTILRYCGITNADGSVYLPSDRIIDGADLYDLWQANVPTSTRVHDKIYYLKKGKCQAIQMAVDVNGTVYDFKYYDKVRTENSAFIDQMYKNYLFNLDTDPAEGYSISKTYPDVAKQLLEELKNFRQEMKDNRRGIL